MANFDPSARTVLEPLSNIDLSSYSGTSLRSLAISSISDSQSLIYVGTFSGSVLLFSATTTAAAPKDAPPALDSEASRKNVSFLRSISLGDSPLETMLVLPEIGKVLVLCDGSLFLVDTLLSHSVKKLSFAKGVCAIAKRIRSSELESTSLLGISVNTLESSSASQRILLKFGGGIRANGVKTKEPLQRSEGNNVFAVVIGKRLVLVELVFGSNRLGKTDRDVDSSSGSFVILKEIHCIDGVKTIAWLNDSIIVGTINGYSLFSCVTGQSGVIFSLPDISSRPQLKLLMKEKKVLMLVDNVGIVVNEHGQPVGGSLVFRISPDSVGELSPYVVLVRNGKMELYNKRSGSCIQTLTCGGEGVGPCIVANEEGGIGKLVAVASPTKVCIYFPLNHVYFFFC